MATSALAVVEAATFQEEDFAEVPPPDIVAYNELRSCADLYRMHAQNVIEIRPEFQRDVVWKSPDQTRFIDSLVKQLPIPSMCFAMDHKQQKWIVIDGLQRMWTIVRFLKGGDWKLSALDDIDPNLSGRSVDEFRVGKPDLRQYYTRVENLSIPITVLRCDFTKKVHLEYLFTIFHRLNTGGLKLNNQEIRNCIYGGTLNTCLKQLDELPVWRKLNKMAPGASYRFTKQEVILRFLAFYDRFEKYDGYLAKFLNTYMHDFRNADVKFLDDRATLFSRTVTVLLKKIYEDKVPAKLPVTYLEAALVGIARNIEGIEKADKANVQSRYKALFATPHFDQGSLVEGLSKKPKVIERMSTAVKVFSGN
jgi:hypothetical protein